MAHGLNRRRFLAAGAAAGLAAQGLSAPAWAACGGAVLLSAASRPDNATWIIGLSREGKIAFAQPTPDRAHAAAAHPARAEVIAFARRPGRFAMVIDCASGKLLAQLDPAAGRHFYGHGAFTADGALLLTTENAFDEGVGIIGIWDTSDGYRRIGEVPSGGVGPHQILRLSSGAFAVANGGIQTHPDFGRAKLNLPSMQPNLTYLSEAGAILEQVAPPPHLHHNSIRHLAQTPDGRVAVALQWQGSPLQNAPLTAWHRRGEALEFLEHPQNARLKTYAGSIALSGDGAVLGVTGPKGGAVLFFDAQTGAPLGWSAQAEAAGAAALADQSGLIITVKGGLAIGGPEGLTPLAVDRDLSWDNHLIAL
ncbi:MAG: DUF1513 domain-containing protein [Neomegalonema sp.]|nr:DUF1513 domain-containing protein [Neomegalonema sp.]